MAAKRKQNFMDESDPIGEGYDKAEAARTSAPSLHEIDRAVYGGGVIVPPSGRQINEPISLDMISRDPAQPRRAIPNSARKLAREKGIPPWQAWHEIAEELYGKKIDLLRLLRGEADIPGQEPKAEEADEAPKPPPPPELTAGFLDLVGLAASIYTDKLNYAITVIPLGQGKYQIETGERRYQAYRMLREALQDEAYASIPAQITERTNPWKQATENNERLELNAIGKSRQVAILLMDMYRDKDGIKFQSFREMVPHDDMCDRPYYDQVSNGNAYRVERGQSARFLRAAGLSTWAQLSQHRRLLRIPNDLWTRADDENMTERQIREELQRLNPNPRKPTDTLTQVKVSPSPTTDSRPFPFATSASPFGTPAPTNGPQNVTGAPLRWPLEGKGVRYMWHMGQRVQLESMEKQGAIMMAHVWVLKGDQREYSKLVTMDSLKETPPSLSTSAQDTDQSSPRRAGDVIGRIYRHRNGRLYQITGTTMDDKAQAFEVDAAGTRKRSYTETLDQRDLAPVPPIPDWLRIGSLVIHDHNEARYRVKGNVKSLDFDNGRYLARITSNGEMFGPYGQERLRPGGGSEPGPETRSGDEDADNGDDYQNQEATPLPNPSLPGWAMTGRIVLADGQPVEVANTTFDRETFSWVIHLKREWGIEHCSVDDIEPSPEGAPLPPKLPSRQEEMLHALYLDTPVEKNAATRIALEEKGMIHTRSKSGWLIDLTDLGRQYLEQYDLTEPLNIQEGKAYKVREGRHAAPSTNEWYLVEKIWENGVINGHIVDAQGNRVHEVGFTFSAINLRLDPNHPYLAEGAVPAVVPATPDLPDWAAPGKTIRHIESGTPCQVTDASYDEKQAVWALTVAVGNTPAYVVLGDFEPYTEEPAAPRERHPALHPSNMNRTICEEQAYVARIMEMARVLGMQDDHRFLMGLNTMTSGGLRTRVQHADATQVNAWLDLQGERIVAVMEGYLAKIQHVIAQAKIIVEDIAAEQSAAGD